MTVTTEIYNAGLPIATISGNVVDLEFDNAQDIFLYTPAGGTPVQCDQIVSKSTAATPAELQIDIKNGQRWLLTQVEATLTGVVRTQLFQWTLGATGPLSMRLLAVYPTTLGGTVDWWASEATGPPVKLRVVVKRI